MPKPPASARRRRRALRQDGQAAPGAGLSDVAADPALIREVLNTALASLNRL